MTHWLEQSYINYILMNKLMDDWLSYSSVRQNHHVTWYEWERKDPTKIVCNKFAYVRSFVSYYLIPCILFVWTQYVHLIAFKLKIKKENLLHLSVLQFASLQGNNPSIHVTTRQAICSCTLWAEPNSKI